MPPCPSLAARVRCGPAPRHLRRFRSALPPTLPHASRASLTRCPPYSSVCTHPQEDFEMSVAKVMKKDTDKNMSIKKLWK